MRYLPWWPQHSPRLIFLQGTALSCLFPYRHRAEQTVAERMNQFWIFWGGSYTGQGRHFESKVFLQICETIGNPLNNYHLSVPTSDLIVEEFSVDAGSPAGFLVNKRWELVLFLFKLLGVQASAPHSWLGAGDFWKSSTWRLPITQVIQKFLIPKREIEVS